MRVPTLAVLVVAMVNIRVINGYREVEVDASNQKILEHDSGVSVAVENQDEGAHIPVSDLVNAKQGTLGAMYNSYHVRPDRKVKTPHSWVLQFVNPKWKYNKDDWKSHLYDWSKIENFQQWRKAVDEDFATDMTKWNDKIWLVNWFRHNNLSGPEVVWYKYSNSTWHSKQPMRWADPSFASPAPLDTQQDYIDGKFTGIDWAGIRNLNSNCDSKIKALTSEPSELMRKLHQFCEKGIDDKKINAGNFVIKASHMSESQGVFVAVGGKLIKDVRSDFIQKLEFPFKDTYSADAEEMHNEIQQMQRERNIKMLPIFKAFPRIATLMNKFKKGVTVCDSHETLAEVQLVMEFQEMIYVAWENIRDKVIPRGMLIEKLRQYDLEIKVSTGMGRAWGFYYNSIGTSTQTLTPAGKHLAYELAEATAIKAGVDYCRVDIVVGEESLIVSELTLVPALNYVTQLPVTKHIKKLIEWHRYYQLTES